MLWELQMLPSLLTIEKLFKTYKTPTEEPKKKLYFWNAFDEGYWISIGFSNQALEDQIQLKSGGKSSASGGT
jgi:hypothetical protein